MNVSRKERRVLDALAQGSRIVPVKDERGRIVETFCFTAEGWRLSLCTLELFQGLRRRKLIVSTNGGPYLISRLGLHALAGKPDR
ncbi:YjhX family toxin [Vulgatibacter incomptus]|uniref:Uncharacterized protein n=1 Tax=Vulgatibacter incomptus TaxID=1391653 RepID=A0A0K1PBK2_9BACT|nr:YjhX family toxin [Vulgatibacter incomptus]AKU90918.1 hypothetical protein AKJ08_1305 [Vulgatibacter incomptus]